MDLHAFEEAARGAGAALPVSDNTALLAQPLTLKRSGRTIPNRMAIQPMEGCDGTAQGAPDILTQRRYHRFAQSGAGLIWMEAVAVQQNARANPRQLMLTEATLPAFQRLVREIKKECLAANGFEPVVIMQATHSGRYSKPNGVPQPIIAYQNPLFEKDSPLPGSCVITDDELARLGERFGQAAQLAQRAGFDGIDIKCCHRYLNSELLSAYQRPGRYGGSLENRTRLLRDSVAAAQAAASGGFIVTSRLNIYDGFPYPYGFGVSPDGGVEVDLSEPQALIGILHQQMGLELLDLTMGNPYVNPHVNRPYDQGPYAPPEDPLTGAARICSGVGQMQRAFPGLAVVSSGLSYLRQFSAQVAAGALEQGMCSIAGFGRMAFAYPQFARDILWDGRLRPEQCCVVCSKCSELMRHGSKAGCVMRDQEVYLPLYRNDVMGAR